MYYFTGCWIFNLKCVCIYELSFWLQSFVCYLIVDINCMASFPLFVSLFSCASQSFSLSCTEVFIKSNLSHTYILLVGNTPLVYSEPLLYVCWFTWHPPTDAAYVLVRHVPSAIFLTCSVEGTSVGYDDWMIKSIACFLWHYQFDAVKLQLVGLCIVNM